MKYRFLFPIMALATMLLSSCAEEELVPQNGSKSCVQFVGRVPGFADYDVTTRAAKTPEESAIKYMTLLIYDNADILISKQSIESSVPLFVVDRNTLLNSSDSKAIDQADVYMITNVSEAEINSWNVETVSDLMAVKHEYDVASLNIPADGFPMMGSMKNVNLNPGYVIPDSKIEIPLENLFAKIVFNIRLETIQDYFSPSFQMTNWEVHNLPKGFGLVGTQNDGQTSFYNDTFDDPVSSRRFTGANPVSGSNTMSFSFYMPEHKVNPAWEASAYSYPAGISANERQRFKPCLVDKECNSEIPEDYDGKPTYVVINGVFTDHQNHQYAVSYKVYLGSDNWQNFQVERNGQYNNSIVIRGVTNSQSGEDGSVSIDHRVNVDANLFMVHMERETLLDSHIEVRPLQIQILDAGDGVDRKIKVYLANPSDPSKAIENYEMTWARMEVVTPEMNTDKYCPYNSKNMGRRKYFTTSLLSDLKDSVEAELTSETNNLWLYFDENTNVSTNGTREIVLVLEYYENKVLKTTKHYTFSQHDLYPVIYQDEDAGIEYRYDIEFFEEYLYNYNPDDDFNSTVAGMPWGPKNTISYEIMAIQGVSGTDGWTHITNAIKNAGGYYDFQNNFWGRSYTTKLINKMNQGVLTQDAMPQSAAQHCHNKNKRNADGTVHTVQWYLPAIGELQHIMSSAYSKFEVFQDSRYWSSQTSYRRGHYIYYKYLGLGTPVEGDYFYEDKDMARATKTTYSGGTYSYEPSEVYGISKTWSGHLLNQEGRFSEEVEPSSRDSGNRDRAEINRVRAVRNKWKRNIGSSTWEEITTEE